MKEEREREERERERERERKRGRGAEREVSFFNVSTNVTAITPCTLSHYKYQKPKAA